MIQAGDLNHKLSYFGPSGTKTSDGLGGFTETDSPAVTCWCSATQMSDKEKLLYGLKVNIKAYKFRVRYEHGRNINTMSTLIFEGVKFSVVSNIQVDEARVENFIIANAQAV